jgi:glycerol-3-phosphate dehydrogenase (NAD(P)+)
MKSALVNQAAVVGLGPWGTSIAKLLSENLNKVLILGYDENIIQVKEINDFHTNNNALKGVTLPNNILATVNLDQAIACDLLFIAINQEGLDQFIIRLSQYQRVPSVVICSKGMCKGRFLSEFISSKIPTLGEENRIAVLSGPNFAMSIAQCKPSFADLACSNQQLKNVIDVSLQTKYFRLVHNNDLVGTQIGGIVKNIIAIACGIADAQGCGANFIAYIISCGLKEIQRLTSNLGGSSMTSLGLSGVGDLVLTCSSDTSRNRIFGRKIVELGIADALLDCYKPEGYFAVNDIYKIAMTLDLDLPVCSYVYRVCYIDFISTKNIDDILND